MVLFSNEIVFRGHPDKVCDQIGDFILDNILEQDPQSRVGIEVTGGKDVIFLTGEISTNAIVDFDELVHEVLRDVGYKNNNIRIINNIGVQSPDIAKGVDTGGAGDQGMMFGYACDDNEKMLPDAMVILQELSKEYYILTQKHPDVFLPDGKAMLTGLYKENKLQEIKTLLVSYQVKEEMRKKHKTDDIIKSLLYKIVDKYGYKTDDINILLNPTGVFEIGGFEGDAGVLGRKIVVDTYHGFYHTGGGALSGKDYTKVDRSGAYKAREIAQRHLKEHNLKWCEVQLSYAIGLSEPLSIMINSDVGYINPNKNLYKECQPNQIMKDFQLQKPKYYRTSMYGHFGGDFDWEL